MFTYDVQAFRQWLSDFLKRSLPPMGQSWLDEAVATTSAAALQKAFMLAPRKTGKLPVKLSTSDETTIASLLPGINFSNWPIDRLTRLYILLHFDEQQPAYRASINQLFLSAEIAELVALYSALPFLPNPESWTARCAEGIRSNMAPVLEAIMYQNPYPKQYLAEPAWNQMIMKAIFTDKQLPRIDGLDDRANVALCNIIIDFAHERWAAHRTLDPQVWRLVIPFLTRESAEDVRFAYDNGDGQTKILLESFLQQSQNAEARKLFTELTTPANAGS
jgi:hypothetical protein